MWFAGNDAGACQCSRICLTSAHGLGRTNGCTQRLARHHQTSGPGVDYHRLHRGLGGVDCHADGGGGVWVQPAVVYHRRMYDQGAGAGGAGALRDFQGDDDAGGDEHDSGAAVGGVLVGVVLAVYVCWDFVSEPSTPGAFMLAESKKINKQELNKIFTTKRDKLSRDFKTEQLDLMSKIKKTQKKVVFADGEDENTLKAAIAFKNDELGIPILVGKKEKIKESLKEIGLSENFDIEITNSTDSKKRKRYTNFLFKKLQREQGLLERDCDRMVRNDRVIWGSCMVSCGDADAMVTGNTRRYSSSLDKVKKVIEPRPGEIMFGLNMMVNKEKTVFIADTTVNEYPSSEQLSKIAISSARVVRLFGFNPKVAFLSHSTFGQPVTSRTKHIRDAVEILQDKKVDFLFDGDMQPDVALNEEYKELYPFSKIVGNANILIMPGQHSAVISFKMMKTLGGAKVIGPLLIGLGQAVEIAPLRSSTSDILNLASVAAYSAGVIDYGKKN